MIRVGLVLLRKKLLELIELRLQQMEKKLKTAANLGCQLKNYIYNVTETLKEFKFIFTMIYLLKITKEKKKIWGMISAIEILKNEF